MAEETRLVRVEERLKIKIGRKRERNVGLAGAMRPRRSRWGIDRESQFPGRRETVCPLELRSGCHLI